MFLPSADFFSCLTVWSNLTSNTLLLCSLIEPSLSCLGYLEEQILSGTVHSMSQNSQAEISQQFDAPEQNEIRKDTPIEASRTENEDAQMEEAPDFSASGENDDPLSRFLPPPVTEKCSAALQVVFFKTPFFQNIMYLWIILILCLTNSVTSI
jgi:hypothetical protein